MAIRLAQTAGFCWGVRRAVDLALRASHEKEGTIYTYGPLIHNQQALDLLKTKHIERLPDDLDNAEKVALLIRAHGITPDATQSLHDRGFDVIDATCPHVKRAQKIAGRQADKQSNVIIVGDPGHAEVDGLLGHAAGRGWVVSRPEDVASLPDDLESVSVVAQTTQGDDRWERCIEAIEARYPGAEVFNTRCNDTNHRQCELIEMTREVDAIVVVGGRGSANTRRLANLAESQGVPTWHIETAEELQFDALAKFEDIGVTAGASTPHWIIEQVVDRLRAMQRRKRPALLRIAYAMAQILLIGHVGLALGAAALAFAVARLVGIEYQPAYSALPFLYLWPMHLLHWWGTLPRDLSLISGPQRLFAAHRGIACVVALIALAASLVLSALMGPLVFGLIAFSTLLGAIYSLGRIPPGWFPGRRFRHFHQIPGTKDLCVALAAVMLIAIVPWVHHWVETNGWVLPPWGGLVPLVLSSAFVFLLTLVRSVAVDFRQIESDLLLGRETLPVILGRNRTHRMIVGILAALAILAVGGLAVEPLRNGLILLAPVVLLGLIYGLTYAQKIRSYLLWVFLLDLPFLAAGVLALIR